MSLTSLMKNRAGVLLFVLMVCFAMSGWNHVSAEEIRVEYIMDGEPLPLESESVERVFSPKFLQLWMQVFQHSEVDLRRELLESIDRAHREGAGGTDRTIKPIMALFHEEQQHPALRLAAVKTLITLGAKESAELLWKCAREDGRGMSYLVEPSLARWDYQPVRDVWLSRLEDRETPRYALKLALQGLAVVREKKAIPGMRQLVLDANVHSGIRMVAARSAGTLLSEGLEQDAAGLIAEKRSNGLLNRLLGVTLLSGHRGMRAETMLKELALDPAPSIATVALKRLMEIDPEIVAVLVPRIIKNSDSNVRELAAHSLVARPSVERIGSLATMLDDPHPRIRRYACAALVQFSGEKRFDAAVRAGGMEILLTNRWRGLEQAGLLLGTLDHKPAADRLVTLLDFERPEVYITSAWALRKLKIPEMLPRMLIRAQGVTREKKEPKYAKANYSEVDFQLGHLYEAFGLMHYRPAEDLMRTAVPKDSSQGLISRANAIWGLGHLYEGKADPGLTKAFVGRLVDVNFPVPEDDTVRRASAISLGRMKSKDALGKLRQFAELEGVGSSVGHACYWAIHQIIGEPIPSLPPGEKSLVTGDWSLSPLEID